MLSETFVLADDIETAHAAANRLFEAVRQELTPVLPPSTDVLHVGATAISGCLTKGDLDIVVRVDHASFTPAEACLDERFARNPGSTRTKDFAAFQDEGATPHLGIQLTAKGGAFDVFHLFTEALRADPDLVRRYNALKRAHHGRSMASYRAAKDMFVTGVLRLHALREPGRRSE